MTSWILLGLASVSLAAQAASVNSVGMRMVPIPAGQFTMGQTAPVSADLTEPLTYNSLVMLQRKFPGDNPARFKLWIDHATRGDFDEHPAHTVRISRPFLMSAYEVTNAQYEQFDPAHRALRGKLGFSKADDEAVVFVTWHQARAFTEWLSKKEGKPYRLPTEAEWEYAARAGTTTLYSTGDHLPAAYLRNARSSAFDEPADIVPTTVGQTPPNPWGLYDMHGNVEEWCLDWYGAYDAHPATDPVGRAAGDFKVTRGGSHGTPAYFLRSANRLGLPPDSSNWIIGFRVVQGDMPATRPLPAPGPQPYQLNVSQRRDTPVPTSPDQPYFVGPRRFVKIPANSHGPLYSHHNHDTAIAACPNGDLLAVWYSCVQERGRELSVAISRLRRDAAEWEDASLFWDAPDRNDHAPALWFDGKDTLYHFNGVGIAGRWAPLAGIVRTSKDNGVTWSRARWVSPEYDFRSMFAQSVVRLTDGTIGVASDLSKSFGARFHSWTGIWFSRDEGNTWKWSEGLMPGIHATFIQLKDGRLMAFGRDEAVNGWMPVSYSSDQGRTWETSASPFPPITSGQRAVLLRLKEGPIVLVSFARDVRHLAPVAKGEDTRWSATMFAAVSFDEGKTWPLRKVISDNKPDHAIYTMDQGRIRMSPMRSESQAYVSITQSADGVIHLLSSMNHYAFNLAWLKQPQADVPLEPQPITLERRPTLTHAATETVPLDPERGFTTEADVRATTRFELRAYAVSGPRLLNRYAIAVTPDAIEYQVNKKWQTLRTGLDNAGAPHRYRLAIRPDTAVQLYRDQELIATLDADTGNDLAQASRGTHLEWTPTEARVTLDPKGPLQP